MSENLEGFIIAGYGAVGMAAGAAQGISNVVSGEGSFGDGYDAGFDEWAERGEAAAEKYGDNLVGEIIVEFVTGNGVDYSSR